jgi:hypothetical protein
MKLPHITIALTLLCFSAYTQPKLEVDTHNLPQIHVKDKKLKQKTLGNKMTSEAFVGSEKFEKGAEIATIIKVKNRKTYLKKFKLNIVENPYSNLKFKLNFYSLENDLPHQLITQEKIFGEFNQKKGMLEVDLTPYNLSVNEDFAVSIEFLDDYLNEYVGFSAGLFGSALLVKDHEDCSWKRLSPLCVGFHMDVSCEK